jgi:hypothetical protein
MPHCPATSLPTTILQHCLADLSLFSNKMHRCILLNAALVKGLKASLFSHQLLGEGSQLSTLIRGGGWGGLNNILPPHVLKEFRLSVPPDCLVYLTVPNQILGDPLRLTWSSFLHLSWFLLSQLFVPRKEQEYRERKNLLKLGRCRKSHFRDKDHSVS